MSKTATGATLATVTALAWGGQFVIGKSALDRVDAFHLTTLRYGIAAAVLPVLLVAIEGRQALRLDGRGLRLLWLGTLGFTGFNLFAYTGLAHSRPESAALISALAPLLTALVIWARTKTTPSRATLWSLAAALAGVMLVISRGNPASIVGGSIGWGDGLVLAGVLCFILYTLDASEFRGISPLRYTALTAGLGWLAILAATIFATVTGLEPEPSAAGIGAIAPQLAYIALIGAVVAVLSWNVAVGSIGPQNVVLFGSLIPVTTFAIEVARGYRPGTLELVGVAVTIAALVTSNLAGRRRAARVARVQTQPEPDLANAA
jgi:drug/metabolite transporter (DMT)-like permease